MKSFPFIRHTNLWLAISGVMLGISLLAIIFFGFKFGIDFTGGSLLEVKFEAPVTTEKVTQTLIASELKLGTPVVTPAGEAGKYILRFRYLENEAEQKQLTDELSKNIGKFEMQKFTATGPTLGASLRERAIRVIVYASIAIVMYLAATFRNTRRDSLTKYVSVGSLLAFSIIIGETMVTANSMKWVTFFITTAIFLVFLTYEIRQHSASLKYGVCAIAALLHDLIIMLGAFVLLGYFLQVEVDSLTLTAMLTIMGFSVHDTIVVFDRLRENRKFQTANETLTQVVDKSLNQTLTRSINTSVSTVIVMSVLFFYGAESIHWFVFALLIGMIVGTYSSIFVAAPMLVLWENRKQN
jgi:preprotein translocase subunit SecF